MTEVKIEPILLSSPKFRRESEDKLAALLSEGWTIAALAGSWVVLARDVPDDLPEDDYGVRADDLRAAEKRRLYDASE